MERTQEFRIFLGESSNGVLPVPGFAAVNVGLHTKTVAVRPAIGLRARYSYKDKILVQADVVCSEACKAVEARFLDMDFTYHPNGLAATQLPPAPRTHDQTALSWLSDVRPYRSGTFQLSLAAELASGQVIYHNESIALPLSP